MSKIEIKAKIDKKFAESAIVSATNLLKPPKSSEFYVIDSAKNCPFVVSDLRGPAKKAYERFCKKERTSMSIDVGKHKHIVVFITPEDLYLRKNKTALIGTTLHEIMHTLQRRKGLDELIYRDIGIVTVKWREKFAELKYNKTQQRAVVKAIMEEAWYALKDIYANTALIKKGLGKYILSDYLNLYSQRKSCPSPIYLEQLHKAAKKDIKVLAPAMTFQIELLAAVIPFLMWHEAKANQLARGIEACYGINVTKITYAFDDITAHVMENFSWKSSFRRKYFDLMFSKIYNLLT